MSARSYIHALARQAVKRALEIDPSYYAAHLFLAEIEMSEGRPGVAVPHFKAASVSPVRRFRARVGLARAYVELGDLARARHLLDALAAERPNDPRVRQIGDQISRELRRAQGRGK